MLKVLRDNLKYLSWILWVVILVFIAFVFVDFGGSLGAQRNATSAAAVVGDSVVTYKDFQRQYRQLEEQYRQAFGERFNQELADQLQLPAVALQRLVNQKLLAAEARRQGLGATDEEVRRRILSIPGIRGEGGTFVGSATYESFLRANGFTAHDFEELIREELAISKLTGVLAASVAIPDSAVEAAWRESHEKASVRYVLAPATRYATRAVATPEQLAAWFADHREEFRLPERRVVDYLLVDVGQLRASIEIPEADLRSDYEQNASQFERPEQVHARHILVKVDESRTEEEARKRIDEIRARLDAGESFASLAAEYSDDPGSRDKGGDVGWFGRGQMVGPFEMTAFGAAPNKIMGPVRTSFGLHLIETLEKRSGGRQSFDEAAAAIRSRLAGERAQAAAEKRARELAAELAAGDAGDEARWRALADDDAVSFVTTSAFGRDDAVAGIGRNPEFAAVAFGLAPGEVSEPVQLPRGWAILRLREDQPEHLPELDEVEARVRAAYEHQRSVALALEELGEARKAIEAGESLDDAAARLGLEVAESGEFGHAGSIPGLGAAAPLADLAMKLDPGALGGPLEAGGGAVLFQVVSRTAFDPQQFASDREQTRERLRNEEADRLLGALVAARRAEVGVTYDPPLLEKYGLAGSAPRNG